MRRNLRLDWRALALLGALLSIIIDWPGLVYAMPTILPSVAAKAAEAATIDTLNVIKNDKMLSYFPAESKNFEADEQLPQKQSKIKNEFTTKRLPNKNVNSFPTTTTLSTLLYTEETTTELEQQQQQQQQQQPQQRLTTPIEKQQQQQVNENYNSISNKQTNDKKQKEITAIHKKTQQNSQDESAAVQKVSLLNTHTKNSTTKMISLTKSINITSPTTNTTIITTTTSPTPPSTSESSAKIQSTLMSTLLTDQSANDDDEQQQPSLFNSHLSTENLRNYFKFSSSHHLAILSRTERSIRSPHHSSLPSSSSSLTSAANISSWGMSLASSGSSSSSRRSSSTGGVGVLVRRSSDMSNLKSKRLNNSRNLHLKNNLDRNERSTVSHLSGPSRKIQLYIKNRFIQLLPDGTVNGTQDEQCDYTRDDNKDDLHNKTIQL